MKTRIVFILTVFIATASCMKNGKIDSDLKSPSTVVKNSHKPVQISKFLMSDPKSYIYFYSATDYTFGLMSAQDSPADAPLIYAYADSKNTKRGVTKASGEYTPRITINDIPIDSNPETKSDIPVNLKPLFGQVVSFGITPQTKSGTDETLLYIPRLISITSPQVSSDVQKHPLCDANNFVLKWNEDSMNDNGVIIQIEWHGIVLFGKQWDDSHVSIAKVFPDTGVAKLEPEMFEGIPDTALCHLTILRGNLNAVVVDDQSFKIGGASHTSMAFVLLRNVRDK